MFSAKAFGPSLDGTREPLRVWGTEVPCDCFGLDGTILSVPSLTASECPSPTKGLSFPRHGPRAKDKC